jgi:hypothetical protein
LRRRPQKRFDGQTVVRSNEFVAVDQRWKDVKRVSAPSAAAVFLGLSEFCPVTASYRLPCRYCTLWELSMRPGKSGRAASCSMQGGRLLSGDSQRRVPQDPLAV